MQPPQLPFVGLQCGAVPALQLLNAAMQRLPKPAGEQEQVPGPGAGGASATQVQPPHEPLCGEQTAWNCAAQLL